MGRGRRAIVEWQAQSWELHKCGSYLCTGNQKSNVHNVVNQ